MIHQELAKFKKVTLNERDFKIRYEDTPLKSHSSLWKKNTIPFDEEYWLVFKALQKSGYPVYPIGDRKIGIKKYGVFDLNDVPLPFVVTPQMLKELWIKKREIGNAKGNFIGEYVQNKLRGKTIKTDYGPFINCLDSVDIISFHNIMIKLKSQADSFVKDFDLIPIYSEFLLGSKKLGVGGLIDDIFGVDNETVTIVDYKTDKEIEFKNKYKQKGLNYLSTVDDCKFNKYRHQLSWYEKIITTETNLKVKDKKVIWFGEDNDDYKILDIPYLEEIDLYIPS